MDQAAGPQGLRAGRASSPSRPRRWPPTRGSTTGSWSPAWCGGWSAGGDLRVPVLTFFLVCVVVAGVYGAATVSRRILVVQAVPAVLALGAVLVAG